MQQEDGDPVHHVEVRLPKSLLSGAMGRSSCGRKCLIRSHIIGLNFQLCCTVFIARINSSAVQCSAVQCITLHCT